MDKPVLPYSDFGRGPVVVFIHGFLENRKMWEGILPEFSDDYRCICVDLPGHGDNSDIHHEESMISMAEKVAHLLNTLNVHEFICIGHSMGGYVACELAQLCPDRLQTIILLASHADCDDPEKKENRTRAEVVIQNRYESFVKEAIPGLFHSDNVSEHETIIHKYIRMAMSHMPSAMVICSKAMKNRESALEKLNKLASRIHFVCGDLDPIIPLEKVTTQNQQLINSSLHVIENCGHMPHIESEKALTIQLLSLLQMSAKKQKTPI